MIATHAGHAEVQVLRSRRAVERWLAGLAEDDDAGESGVRSAPSAGRRSGGRR
jgi:hypothetical protein